MDDVFYEGGAGPAKSAMPDNTPLITSMVGVIIVLVIVIIFVVTMGGSKPTMSWGCVGTTIAGGIGLSLIVSGAFLSRLHSHRKQTSAAATR